MSNHTGGKMRCEGYGSGGQLTHRCLRRAHVGLTLLPSPYLVALCYQCAAAATAEGREAGRWDDYDAISFTRRFYEQVMALPASQWRSRHREQ